MEDEAAPHDANVRAQTLFKIDNEKALKWVVVDVATLPSGEPSGIQCVHCHGRVRVHKRTGECGPEDRVEHRSRQDSENCRGGHYFKGEHGVSLRPEP
jgi:hypothetical protein